MKNFESYNFANKKVLIRVDFNVPFNDEGEITDDTRVRSALPTINKILKDQGSVLLMSHLGRPKGKVNPALSLRPVAQYLNNLIDAEVKFSEACTGEIAENASKNLKPGEVLVLENLRIREITQSNKLLQLTTIVGTLLIQNWYKTQII